MKNQLSNTKFVKKTNLLYWLVFFACFGIACAASAEETAGNTFSFSNLASNLISKIAIINDIKDTLIAVFVVSLILFSLISQWLHIQRFLKGRCLFVLPQFWLQKKEKEYLGTIVKDRDRKDYRKFKSDQRKKVVDRLNKYHEIFLVMGPAGVGKRLLSFSEIQTDYIIKIERKKWYDEGDSDHINNLLEERLHLLVSNLHIPLLWKRSISIVLMWDNDSTMSVPDQDKMQAIINKLTQLIKDNKLSNVSFVLPIPAYYQEFLDNNPEMLLVNRLNGSECLGLLSAELEYRRCGTKILDDLEAEAKKLKITPARILWIETFGMPKYVTDIVSKLQYDSQEAWKALSKWWKQVYDKEDKEPWLAYLYILALKSMLEKEPVNARELARIIFGNDFDKTRSVEKAVKLMCVKRRPDSDNDIIQRNLCAENKFDLHKVDAEILFEDKYVIECFVSSLGGIAPLVAATDSHKEISGVFDFVETIPAMMARAFNLDDPSESDRIAKVYFEALDRYPDFVDKLNNQYLFLEKLRKVFEDLPLVQAYEHRLKDPNRFQGFVLDLISRLGAIPDVKCLPMFERINSILLSNNTSSDYARLTFEMLPAYVISGLFLHCWNVKFHTLIKEMKRPDAPSDVKFKCAAIICCAYASLFEKDTLIHQKGFKDLFDILDPIYTQIQDCFDEKDVSWNSFKVMLPLTKSWGEKSTLPKIDFSTIPSDIRIAYLSIISSLLWKYEYTKAIIVNINNSLAEIEFDGTAGMLLAYCRSKIPYSYVFDINTDDGVAKIKESIKKRMQIIERWLDCPAIAAYSFNTICKDYMHFYEYSKYGQLDSNVLSNLFSILNNWRTGLKSSKFSSVLANFCELIRCVSDFNKDNIDLKRIWPYPYLTDLVHTFWKPILNNKNAEDSIMGFHYFKMISSLSNVESISVYDRTSMLEPFLSNLENSFDLLYSGVYYPDSAWYVYKCNSVFVPRHVKMFWCSLLLSGLYPDPWPDLNNVSETLLKADELIQDARNDNDRIVDEKLVKLLYEENGLPYTANPDTPVTE
ncbi:hypothetical protein J6U78_07520 [bacterium]|nr:hypothetical protein [bacterium]